MKKLLSTILLLGILLSPKVLTPTEFIRSPQQRQQILKEASREFVIKSFQTKLKDKFEEDFINDNLDQKVKKLITAWGEEKIINEIERISKKFNISPIWLMKVIIKESRGSPTAVNKHSNATGIIQWMPKTAIGLGTTVDKLKTMSVFEQLRYVDKYLSNVNNIHLVNSYEDLYLAIFWPAGLGKDDSYIIGARQTDSVLIAQNSAVDVDKDGIITLQDFKLYANL